MKKNGIIIIAIVTLALIAATALIVLGRTNDSLAGRAAYPSRIEAAGSSRPLMGWRRAQAKQDHSAGIYHLPRKKSHRM